MRFEVSQSMYQINSWSTTQISYMKYRAHPSMPSQGRTLVLQTTPWKRWMNQTQRRPTNLSSCTTTLAKRWLHPTPTRWRPRLDLWRTLWWKARSLWKTSTLMIQSIKFQATQKIGWSLRASHSRTTPRIGRKPIPKVTATNLIACQMLVLQIAITKVITLITRLWVSHTAMRPNLRWSNLRKGTKID